MTIEEIECALRTVAENQAQFRSDIGALLDQTEKLAALHHQTLRSHEERQVGLEDAFKQLAESHRMLVALAHTHEERIDQGDADQIHTDARLDALIDSQIQIGQRVGTLISQMSAVTGRIDDFTIQTKESLSQLEAFIAETARQVRALAERKNGK